jgi:hypothetical protein
LDPNKSKEPDKIVTLLTIEALQGGRDVFDYDEDDLTFHTKNPPQTLYVEVRSPQSHGSPARPRYHLHKLVTDKPALIDAVDYSFSGHISADWHPYTLGAELPEHAKTFRIKLKIQGKDHLQVKIDGWDRKDGELVPCDPLVGNDPPANEPGGIPL